MKKVKLPVRDNILYVCVVLVLLVLTACESNQNQLYKEQFFVFGTIVELNLWGADKKQIDQASSAIAEDLKFLHRAMGPRETGSLARMNNLFPSRLEFVASPALLPLIKQAKTLSNQSNHLFNPAIGKLVSLWNFVQTDLENKSPPGEKLITDLVAKNPNMDNLHIDGITLRSDNDSFALDFGGVAKGYAIDTTIDMLRGLGINNAIVNAGGDLRAIGKHGDRNWLVGIRHPRQKGMIASLEINEDESIFTSGDYERFYEFKGKRYHHILDPRTGYPAEGVTSVTVIHSNGTVADAAATALFVAGVDQWYDIAKSMGIKWVMLIDKNQNIHMNPAMKKRVQFELERPPTIILSQPLQ